MVKKAGDPKVKRRLRNLLINQPFQVKHLCLLGFVGIILIAQSCFIFYYFVKSNYTLMATIIPSVANIQGILFSDLRSLALMLAFTLFMGLMFFLFVALLITHQAAGPLYRFKRVFEQVESGDMKARVHLRKRDDFKDVADSFNRMMDSLAK